MVHIDRVENRITPTLLESILTLQSRLSSEITMVLEVLARHMKQRKTKRLQKRDQITSLLQETPPRAPPQAPLQAPLQVPPASDQYYNLSRYVRQQHPCHSLTYSSSSMSLCFLCSLYQVPLQCGDFDAGRLAGGGGELLYGCVSLLTNTCCCCFDCRLV